jgi:DNA polymerase-4
MKAAALAPDAVLLPTDFDEYRRFSMRFKAAVADVASIIEDRGIDEIFIDLSDVAGAWNGTANDAYAGIRSIAMDIKARVKAATGLTCSIGITPNKLLAKLCSDLDKPDGLTILTVADIPQRIWPLPVRRINGIGPKANERLAGSGIRTIGDLAAADPAALLRDFGLHYGAWLHEAAHGRDDRPVVTHREPKSVSRETTFESDLHPSSDRAVLGRIFTQLCERLSVDLRAKHYSAQSIGIKLRYHDFRIVTRELSLAAPIDDAKAIRQAAGQCLLRVPLDQRLRLLGVRAGALRNANGEILALTAAPAAPAAPIATTGSLFQ